MKPGDIVENGWASEDNPWRTSIVIRDEHERLFCTDGKGQTFYTPKSDKIKVVGHVTLSPIEDPETDRRVGQDKPDYEALVFKELGPLWFLSPAVQITMAGARLSLEDRQKLWDGMLAKHTPQPEETPEGE